MFYILPANPKFMLFVKVAAVALCGFWLATTKVQA
jgi:hypothetical protein